MKKKVSRADENSVRQLFGATGKVHFFIGAAYIGKWAGTRNFGTTEDDNIAELLVTLEFNLTKEYPAIDELMKTAGVVGQVTKPWCTIIGCTTEPVKTIEMEGKLMSFCRKHVDELVALLR